MIGSDGYLREDEMREEYRYVSGGVAFTSWRKIRGKIEYVRVDLTAADMFSLELECWVIG